MYNSQKRMHAETKQYVQMQNLGMQAYMHMQEVRSGTEACNLNHSPCYMCPCTKLWCHDSTQRLATAAYHRREDLPQDSLPLLNRPAHHAADALPPACRPLPQPCQFELSELTWHQLSALQLILQRAQHGMGVSPPSASAVLQGGHRPYR